MASRACRGSLPLRVLLENLLRHEDGRSVTKEHIQGFSEWLVE